MKIKLSDIVNSEEALTNIQKSKLPIKTSYWITRFIQKITPDLKNFYEQRMELFKKLGEEDKEKNIFTIKKENLEEFQEELKKLADIEIEVDINKFKIEDFGELNIEPENITKLDYLIDDSSNNTNN